MESWDEGYFNMDENDPCFGRRHLEAPSKGRRGKFYIHCGESSYFLARKQK